MFDLKKLLKFSALVVFVMAWFPNHAVLAQDASLDKKKPKKASELIQKQPPAKVSARVMEKATQDNTSVFISLGKQRVYLMVGDEIAIDSPISSGKRKGWTPSGSFKVMEKDPDHRSNIYGNFVDAKGRVVRAGVSSRIDSAPSGTRYEGAPMKWFMRLTGEGVGMHVGILPGYPASHGCVRLPVEIAPLIYNKVKVGTPVKITE
ncbi:MAG: L,D-transpeptidase family protein [Chthoniobacterales bacterium]